MNTLHGKSPNLVFDRDLVIEELDGEPTTRISISSLTPSTKHGFTTVLELSAIESLRDILNGILERKKSSPDREVG